MVGGAVRNALLGEPIGDIDIATTALPEEVIRRADGRGLQGGADRHRARHRHGRRRRPSVRGDDAARGRRDLRPPRQGRASAATGRRDAERRDFTMNALFGLGRRHRARLCRRACRSRRAARALHRRARRSASPRTICASCASSASTPPMATARPIAAGLHACIAARAGLEQLSRERVRMELLKLLVARHAVPTLAVMAEDRPAACRCSAACPISRASPT